MASTWTPKGKTRDEGPHLSAWMTPSDFPMLFVNGIPERKVQLTSRGNVVSIVGLGRERATEVAALLCAKYGLVGLEAVGWKTLLDIGYREAVAHGT